MDVNALTPLAAIAERSQMTRRKTYVLIGSIVAVAAVLVAVEMIAEITFNRRLFRADIHAFRVSGKVIDDETGEPVPRAHIIILTHSADIKPEDRCHGLIGGEDGTFSVTHETPYPIMRSLSILAASPSNKYAERGDASLPLPVKRGVIIAENVILQVQPIHREGSSAFNYRYSTFSAGCQGGMEFLGRGWFR